MFPNMRLLVGALLASVVVLCGGFAVFAAFRVNHEPLSRLPADTVALQLVANETAGPPPVWRATPAFAASESVTKARIDSPVTDAPRSLPVSHITIQPSDLTAISAVRPAAIADAPLATMLPRHVSLAPPASAIPAVASGAATSTQTAPPASAAANNIAAAKQASAAPTRPAQSAADAKPEAAGKTGEVVAAPMPTVAAIEQPASNPISPNVEPDVANILPDAAVPEPKPRPAFIGAAARRTLRKEMRQAAQRRRIAARQRTTGTLPGSTVAQFGYQNSAFGNPFFQSAPGAFQRQPERKRAAPANRAAPTSNSIAGNPVNWSSSQ